MIFDTSQEINHYRDKTSSIMLEMERKESEIEDLLQDGDARDVEVENLRKDWQAELDHTRAQRDEAREVRFFSPNAMQVSFLRERYCANENKS